MKITSKLVWALTSHWLVMLLFFAVVYAEDRLPSELYEFKIETVHHMGKDVALITVTGIHGYHINIDYPWELTVRPKDGLVVNKYNYLSTDAETMTDEKAVFRVPFQVKKQMSVEANLKLAVCREKRCTFDDIELNWFAAKTR